MEPSALRGVENGFIAGLLPLLRGGLRGEERGKQRYLCLNGSNSEHSRTRYKSIV